MNQSLLHQIVVDTERRLLLAQAERGRLVEEARAARRAQRTARLMARTRWTAGEALVRAGARLQGSPRLEPGLSTSAA